MELKGTTFYAVIAVVLIAGLGIGYVMAPVKTEYKPPVPIPNDISVRLDGIVTLLYGAVGASLIAALAAILALMQISKNIA